MTVPRDLYPPYFVPAPWDTRPPHFRRRRLNLMLRFIWRFQGPA